MSKFSPWLASWAILSREVDSTAPQPHEIMMISYAMSNRVKTSRIDTLVTMYIYFLLFHVRQKNGGSYPSLLFQGDKHNKTQETLSLQVLLCQIATLLNV